MRRRSLARRKPLRTRIPLRRRTPLRRRSPLRRRKGLRRISARQRRRLRQWQRVRVVYLTENPCCERCLYLAGEDRKAFQVHHIVGRHGRWLHAWWNLVALCRRCHNGNRGAAHERPRESKGLFMEIKCAKGE